MAEIVAGFGVPHNPMAPATVEREGPESPTGKLYAAVRREIEAVEPDVLLVFDSDHLSTFFFNNLPIFCVGISDTTIGPNDTNSGLPRRSVSVNESLATEVFRTGIASNFDLARSHEFEIDHSIMVPLHFLTPSLQVPIVPVFINGLAPPLPSARRCHELGQAVGQAIRTWPSKTRVAILASGSFSLEVAGPRVGITDHVWMDTVMGCMSEGRIPDLLEQATTERVLAAGNVSGELFNWIAMLGAVNDRRPTSLEPQVGHAFGVWRWE
jgi:hypothetical protein